MIRRTWLKVAGGAAAAAGAGVLPGATPLSASAPTSSPSGATPVFALRNPNCGCCEGWADHLREHEFEVHLHDTEELEAVKRRLGLPEDLDGCHTAIVEGYVVEGHVPAKYIRQILDESPEISGIAVPGMPMGSPGMESPNPEPYEVIAYGPGEERYVLGSEGA